jgi:hypothetical protein
VSRNDAVRGELKKAAPHAFRPPAKPPAGAKKVVPQPVGRAPVRAVANAAPKGGGRDDWDEF